MRGDGMALKRRTFPVKKTAPVIFSGKLWSCLCLSFILVSTALAGPTPTPTATPTPINSIAKRDPLISNGKELYSDLRCEYCHKLNGRGGTVGPALDYVGFRRTKEWMTDHFRDPKTVSPGTKMTQVKLRASQVLALVAFMNSLGGYTFTSQAARLFNSRCSACHKLHERGANRNDLSQEGKYRDMGFLIDYISDPAQLNAGTKMKSFKGILTRAQIKDIAAYLYENGR